MQSLDRKGIAISDLIISCQRNHVSALDSDLKHIAWNIELLTRLLAEENITRILCTSKFVLTNLYNRIIKANDYWREDKILSNELKNNLISSIGGNVETATGSIAKVFYINGRKIEAIAIPSPGSPYRQIATFGCGQNNKMQYAEIYCNRVFSWLCKKQSF